MTNAPFSFSNQTLPQWLNSQELSTNTVLSSRVRFARNLAGFPFPTKATFDELKEILNMVSSAITKEANLSLLFSDNESIYIDKLNPLRAEFLVERHLISPDFIQINLGRKQKKTTTNSNIRAVFINNDETISLMINEEDHLRFQVLTAGFNFKTGYEKLDELDSKLEAVLRFAFSQQYGYLTACPSNVGTALRTSVLIHLPGLVLTKEIEKVLRAVWQIGYAVRGLYGEGSETRGHFFQISNTVTLGQSEPEIIEGIEKVTNQLIGYEDRARDYLLKNMKSELEDKIFRAQAVLKSARLITSVEALNLLATVRLGVATQIVSDVSMSTVNKIMLLLRPANLQIFYNQEMSPNERDEKRAALIKQLLQESRN
jgi:protein arginine kinase